MTGQIEIIGANKGFEEIKGKEFSGSLSFSEGLHSLRFNDEKYCFEIKDILFKEEAIVLNSWASDEKLNIGQISIAFKPNNS
jgi:hypothetical protein